MQKKIIAFLLVVTLWSFFIKYDIKDWDNPSARRKMIALHQFDKVDAPELKNNKKCIEDGVLQFNYKGDLAIFRCGSIYWPFYDKIIVSKETVKEAYRLSTQ